MRLIDWFANFVDTRPKLYMSFVILYIIFALSVAGNMEREPEIIIAQEQSQ